MTIDSRSIGISQILVASCLLAVAQILIKARLSQRGVMPFAVDTTLVYFRALAGDWQMWLGAAIILVVAFLWYAGVSRVPLSIAYSLSAISYPLILAGSLILLNESISWQLIVGNIFIVSGIILIVNSG
jgi:drug/metabolite transporter (DMT)-like permease